MNGPRRSGPTPAGPAGGPAHWRPSPGLLALALALVAGGFAWMALSSSPPAPPPVASARGAPAALPASSVAPAAAAPAVALAASAAAPLAPTPATAAPGNATPAATPQIVRSRDPNGDQTPDIADFVNRDEQPTMAEVIDRLHRAGVHSGLGAFSPPGSRPPLVGLAVPEDFVLPDGYVRHHQATDDGQRIEAILMFAPDRQFVDSARGPIAIPQDRVVPPELAPPGLPIRRIVIPAPREPGK